MNDNSANSDVMIGVITWSAGAFGTNYELTETPTLVGSTWNDQDIVKKCVMPLLGQRNGQKSTTTRRTRRRTML
jgi:hypothetical protein